MSEVSQICFCIDGEHQDWCPNKKPDYSNSDLPDFFKNVFNSYNAKKTE